MIKVSLCFDFWRRASAHLLKPASIPELCERKGLENMRTAEKTYQGGGSFFCV